MSNFTKEILDSVTLTKGKVVPGFVIASPQFVQAYKKAMVVIADRQWRKRNWGKRKSAS